MYGNEKALYAERNYGPETAQMDPYTVQITNRLSECEKNLADITVRVYRLTDRLFGPAALAKPDPVGGLNGAPIQKAIMEQIVAQSNVLNRKLNELSEALFRLESL